MQVEQVKLEDLKPYERNAKKHPQDQIEQIKASIQELGFNDPIGIDENNVIIEGHGRYEALKQLGYKEAPCIRITGLSDQQKKAYILAHNKLTMTWPMERQKSNYSVLPFPSVMPVTMTAPFLHHGWKPLACSPIF